MPDHWQETTVGEAAEVVSGGTPRTTEPDFWNGEIVWVTPTEVVANEGKVISDSERKITPEGLAGSSAKMLPVDAVLLTSRATIGAVALAGVPLATNQGFASLVCGDDLTPRFAMYWCQANTSEFLSRAGGNTFLEISRKRVAAIPLLLPPLEEQRRIVDLVGSIDTYIDSLETQIETTRTARSALLSELLSNPGDHWEETTLGDVADWFAGGTPKATNPAFYTDGQIPWAVIADLLHDPVVETAKQINEDGLDAIGGRLAPVGSILVSMYGTIARTAIAGVPLATNQAIAWAEPHSDTCDGEFLRLLVDRLQPAFESAARGAAQKNINRGMIKDAGVLLPPLAEQHRIVDLVGSFDEQVSSLESQVESVRTLRSGVLSELLSGERLLDESYDMAVGL